MALKSAICCRLFGLSEHFLVLSNVGIFKIITAAVAKIIYQLFKTLGHIVLCHKCDCTQHSQTEGKLLVLIVSLLPAKLLDPSLDDRGEVAEAAFYLSILIQALHCINYEPFKIK